LQPHKTLLGGIAIDITDRKRVEQELERALSDIELLNERLEAENIYLREEIKLEHQHESFIGKSHAVKYVLHLAEEVAKTDSTVLILGETGTGKELLAREIHNLSARKNRPIVNVNCVSLPPSLVEAELFGREKGAYTGALTRQAGRFEIADGATIFLDEIGELPLGLQVKLLRILDQGQFERLGSSKTLTVDVRVIAATNRDLEKEIAEGKFREDLYFRLNVYSIKIPPLRDRLEDIPPLVWAFVREFGDRMGKKIDRIPRNAIEALKRYDWPGNVRELRNAVERAMIVSRGSTLEIDKPRRKPVKSSQIESLDELQRNHIVRALETTGWRVSGKNGAAEILKINPKTLQSRMRKLGINRA
jgi:transcriptional regulator with GAF, ATPase, and Fis domain